MKFSKINERRTGLFILLIFTFLSAGLIITGYLYYKNFEKEYLKETSGELSVIADLKVDQLVQWRKERLADANVFYRNILFSSIVKSYFKNKNDLDAKNGIQTWIDQVYSAYLHNKSCLFDTAGNSYFCFNNNFNNTNENFSIYFDQALRSGKIVFQDFYRDREDNRVYLSIFIPILDEYNTNIALGVLAIRIDPAHYLYPMIQKWPALSKSAETLIVRREGNEAVFLNELRFQKNTALNLRRPLTQIDLPAVQAALGTKGIIEGVDYRGVPVIAYVCSIPESPWALVSRMDITEIRQPLNERLWTLAFVVLILIGITSTILGMVWRNQSLRLYKERYESAESIRKLNRVYAILSDINQAIVRTRDLQQLFDKSCTIAVEQGNFLMAWIGKMNLQSNKVKVTASSGIINDYLDKIDNDLNDKIQSHCLSGRAIKSGIHVISNDCENDENLLLWQSDFRKYGFKSIASFPLIVNNMVWGAFSLYAGQTGFFDDKEIKLLDELAMDLSFAIEFSEKEAERKKSQQQLEYQYTLLTALINSPQDIIIFSLDNNYCYTVFNEKHRQEMKRVWNIDIKVGMKLLDCMSVPEIRALAKISIDRALGGEIFSEEQYQPDLDIFYDFSWNPIYQNKKVIGVTVFIRDITARKKAEKELLYSQQLIQGLIDNSPSLIYLLDLDGKFILLNKKLEEVLNLPKEKMLGNNRHVFMPYETAQQHRHNDLAVISSKLSNSFEEKNLEVDGEHFYLTQKFPLFDLDGKVYAVGGISTDITERKKAEEKFRNIFENSPLGKSITGVDGSLSINKSFSNMLGYSVEELSTKNWQEITHPDDIQESTEIVKSIIEGERLSAQYEKRYLHKDGRTIQTEVSTTLQRDNEGKPLYFITSINNITQRKKAEEELKANAEFINSIIKSSRDCIKVLDMEGNLLSMSAGGQKLLEIDDITVYLNKSWVDFWKGKDREGALEAISIAKYNDIGRFTGFCKTEKGTPKWWDVIVTPIKDSHDNISQLLAISRDITEGKKSEEEIKQNEKRWRELLEALPQLVWTCSVDGPCDYLSPQWLDYTGIPEEKQLGYGWLEQLHPEDREITIAEWMEKVKTGKDFDIEYRIRRYDGIFRWFKTKAIPLRDLDGKIVKWFGSNTDFDDVKNSEEAIRKLNIELEQRVVQRTAQLVESNKDLESFSYSVSHDLRAPLRGIDGFSNILLEDYSNILNKEGQRLLNVIRDNTKKMGQLIDDLLSFSRIGSRELEKSNIDMKTLANSIYYELTSEQERAMISINISKIPDVKGDPSLIRQLWNNLISNAVKFTSKNEKRVIEIGSKKEKGIEIYFIKDNGVGFDMKFSGKLFGVFQRLHSEAEFTGTGVGLAIAKRIVDKHGGKIWAQSEIKVGTTVYFNL